mgnify:CR=1 FL=1
MFYRIVVATDFSDCAKEALDLAKRLAAAPGSERWNAVRDELIELGFTIDPTLNIYEMLKTKVVVLN